MLGPPRSLSLHLYPAAAGLALIMFGAGAVCAGAIAARSDGHDESRHLRRQH